MKNIIVFLLLIISLFGMASCATVDSSPALVSAAQTGNFDNVKRLVEVGADVNERSRYGHSALEQAALNGHLEIVEYLLSKNANDPRRAFQNALRNNHINIAKLIVEGEYFNINHNAQYFSSILNNNQISFAQRMQNVKYITGDKLNSPYLLALVDIENYQQIIEYFNINLNDKTDVLGNSILHVGAMRNNFNLVKYLLENKFNVNVLDNNNHTALFYCITSFGPSINWNIPIIENETTARINYISDMPFYRDPTDLKMRQAQIGILLLDYGIKVNQQNNSGWTVLHFASASYPAGPRAILIERGADQNIKTNYGRTDADIMALRN